MVKTARLGDVLYRTACAVAALWATFVFIVTATLSLPDWTIATPIAAVGPVVIWSTGRAARYVLSRVDKAVATAMLAFLYIPTVIFAAAFLFAAVERLEPNRRLAIVFKCAILAAGGAAIAKQLLP